MKMSPLSAATGLDVDSASDFHNSTLSKILEKMIPFKSLRLHERLSDPRFDRECRTSKCLKRILERVYMRKKSENDFAAWVRRDSTKNCVDTSVKVTGIINSVIQKTKRLLFGATLLVSLVEKRYLLLMNVSLLILNLFC